MYDYGEMMHLIIGGGVAGAVANGALALVNTANQRRIVRQQRVISDRQQQLETQRLELDQRAQIWSEMRDLIDAQGRQLQASRFELTQLTGKYEELLRRHQTLEGECRQRHRESIARIEALELERNRWKDESNLLRSELESERQIAAS
jgi:chromosome segregation ATPase